MGRRRIDAEQRCRIHDARTNIGSRVAKEMRQRKMPGCMGFFAVAFMTREPIIGFLAVVALISESIIRRREVRKR